MAFHCWDVDEYIKIYQNPSLGLKYLLKQKLKQQNHERKIKQKMRYDEMKRYEEEMKKKKMEKGETPLLKAKKKNEDDSYIESDDESENEYEDVEEEMMDDESSIDSTGSQEDKLYDKDLEFQILDIDSYNVDDDNDEETQSFNIMLFGKTKEDKSVYVNVEGYRPYFYVEVNSEWRGCILDKIVKDVQKVVYPKNLVNGLLTYKVIEAHKFHGFTDNENIKFLQLIFRDYESMRAYARTFEKKHTLLYISRHRKIGFTLYESKLHPIFRFLHTQNVDPIGWCKISRDKFKKFGYGQRKGTTDINVNCNWKDVQRHECEDIHKFKIMSFDIECNSEDGKMPCNREGDEIIQIGMTYSRLGETECYKEVVLCLKKTACITPGSIVKCYNTEAELLLAFKNEFQKNDPDIITGYNIWQFDLDYMRNRAKKFDIYAQFSRFSRIKGHVCKFIEQKLESAAMGRNNLKYYNTPGRVCIDLMKVVQRDHKLTKYTLENVAATFIRGGITGYEYIYETEQNKIPKNDKYLSKEKDIQASGLLSEDCFSSDYDENEDIEDVHIREKQDNSGKKRIKQTILKVKSVKNIKVGDYVAIYYNDGPTDNVIGEKKKVLEIDMTKGKESILVDGKVRVRPYLKKKWDVFWCQGKDDMEAKDIFRMYKGNANERGIVAKYCMKDCSLCNRLLAMLQILPNNIGMGNVCTVPLSYLFTRGQSIKIFSLVAKECRDENYLIPDNKRKLVKKLIKDANGNIIENSEYKVEKTFQRFIRELINEDEDDDDDDDDSGYEGATVFDPTKGVHYEPIIVGDYSSLYPSSMIMKNLSHNSIVLDPKYDNLPGYKYYEQSYNKPDGSKASFRFAEKLDGTKATIPRILQKLLSARKKYNNLKGSEKDPFKKAVWDGLQLAYKVTANSLYGQCGSSISPIAMKPIAACTTSIGRDMLELARDFVENEMNTIIHLIKEAIESNNDDKFLAYMRNYYKDVPEKRVGAKEFVVNEKGEKVEKAIYTGKEEYYQWIKIQIYQLVGQYNIRPECIYGDTDSVFFKLNLTNKVTGEPFNSHESLKISIDMGVIGTGILNHTLAYPQALAYEKVYWPFIILSKKRYVGNLYSDDPNKFYQKSMGLVTKRRDNADIVKVVVGGIIDQILNHRSPEGAVKFTESRLMRIITGKYGIDKFIITKTLRDKETYKNWMNMSHVVLADRMAQRDAGNKPQSNDRIPFVFIEVKKNVKLQGERVEHPAYILENNLKIDFMYYIEFQIMKPALQFLEQIVKNPYAIFKKYIIREENRKGGTEPIMKCLGNMLSDHGNGISVNFGESSSDDLFGDCPPSKNLNQKRKTVRSKLPKIFQ